MPNSSPDNWKIYQGNHTSFDRCEDWTLPPPPAWRPFGQESRPGESRRLRRAETFQPQDDAINMVNAAMYLRRPLLITGRPGTGKSSLAYAVAKSLALGEVLYWPITTRTTLKNGLYDYDAIGRLQDAQQQERLYQQVAQSEDSPSEPMETDFSTIGNYITLGPLGTALMPSDKPRVLLIDEIDKSDIDLPNDLLTVLEEGRFEIPELVRLKEKAPQVSVRTAYPERDQALDWQSPKHTVENGAITCTSFPLVFLTSNGERAFPPPFLRRCLRLHMQVPKDDYLQRIVDAHLEQDLQARKAKIESDKGKAAAENWYVQALQDRQSLIQLFEKRCRDGELIATDQLLNALFMLTREHSLVEGDKAQLIEALMKQLSSTEDG